MSVEEEDLGRLRIKALGQWRALKGDLCAAVERDFERKVLPLLRLFWPEMVQVPPRDRWDRKGIDLFAWTEDGPFPCVVQCKGFHVQRLERDQVHQTLQSIETFAASDVQCLEYLVLYNRDGGHRDYVTVVSAALQELVANQRVPSAELWDIDMLLSKVAQLVTRRVTNALRLESTELYGKLTSLFRFGQLYLPEVPIQEERLHFRRDRPCVREEVGGVRSMEVARLLADATEARWTLLTGNFGAGKTTSSLHSVMEGGRIVIYAACAALKADRLRSSTNALLTELIGATGAFDDFADDDRALLEGLAGPTLAKLLRRPETRYSILLDALDETVAYATVEGLQQLSNQLSELECPIILTTRKEHFEALFGDFSVAFTALGEKNAPARYARHLLLLPWSRANALDLVRRSLGEADSAELPRLQKLEQAILAGDDERFYGDLLGNPLFLQFILEDVAVDGMRKRSRAELIRDWAERKIRRDIARRPSGFMAGLDVEEAVARMMATMEDVAAVMTTREPPYELLESIPGATVEYAAAKRFDLPRAPIVEVLLNSLLVTNSERKGTTLEIGFVFRVVQEFFLASSRRREGLPMAGYPESVLGFWREMTLGGGPADHIEPVTIPCDGQ